MSEGARAGGWQVAVDGRPFGLHCGARVKGAEESGCPGCWDGWKLGSMVMVNGLL